MIGLIGTVQGMTAVQNLLEGVNEDVIDAVEYGMKRGILGAQSVVRGNARGRPGPRAVTGDFNRTIVGDTEVSGSTVLGQIGTNAAQALRLEFGFRGADVLGRVYNQPPYAYMQPSVPGVEAEVVREISAAIQGRLGRWG